ncbi:TetR/AcrR family transcriptional regulator [Streptomyces sp. NPDC005132]|uniref:TetR/AcrR family transcriptional regulator n=1 Tax=Streptomyces sp. NPDC005132 TaxID=3154294 RepID=UPI0033B3D5B5
MPDLTRREELLDHVREYLVRHGVADLSLRPLARDLGTSDRMLLYCLRSKERMITEALAAFERRPLLHARRLLAGTDPPRDAAGLRRFMEETWRQFNLPEVRATLPLYLEVMAAGLFHPDRYGPVVRDVLSQWTDLLTSAFRGLGMTEDQAGAETVLVADAVFGLLVVPLGTGTGPMPPSRPSWTVSNPAGEGPRWRPGLMWLFHSSA